MKLLAIDTVTENCSTGLLIAEKPELVLETVTPAGHSRLIHEMIDRLLIEAAISLGDLNGIVVDIGPGSFTGVRIGIGIAQGLGYGAALNCLPVSSLQALATCCNTGLCLSVIDARMNQVYWALYQCREIVPDLVCGPFVSDPGQVVPLLEKLAVVPKRAAENVFGAGSGWAMYRNQLPETMFGTEIDVLNHQFPGAAALLKIARGVVTKAGTDQRSFISPMKLHAAYVRNDIVREADHKRP